MKLSIISPVYKASGILNALIHKINDAIDSLDIDYEIILVDDGCPENSWQLIQKECLLDEHITGIRLSRNFGQHIAITAGLGAASGDWVVVMDCDLQDDPAEIPRLLKYALEHNLDIVQAKRRDRQDHLIKRWSSKAFYMTLNSMTGTNYDPEVANYGIYSKQVVNAVLQMHDRVRFFPLLVQWVGFKSGKLYVVHNSRYSGKSSYSFKKLFSLAFQNIIAFSSKPLRLTAKVGFLIALISIIVGLITLALKALGAISVVGYTGIIISIYFSLGLLMFTLGIVGLYIGDVLDHSKGRPLYFIAEKIQ